VPLGTLIEGQATNLWLNSAIPATQSFTTTAQSYTLSVYGAVTITLSGTATGTLTATGAANVRTTLTFTATAGTLTATVSALTTGNNTQLETGSVATSYIPTGTGTMVRAGDFAGGGITGTDLTTIFSAGYAKNTVVLSFIKGASSGNEALFALSSGATFGTGNGLFLRLTGGTIATCGGNLTTVGDSGVVVDGVTVNTVAISWDTSITEMSMSVNGRTPVTLTSLDFTGSGTTALILGALTSAGSQVAIAYIGKAMRVVPGEYLTGAALQGIRA
jgi:hypothetical protein